MIGRLCSLLRIKEPAQNLTGLLMASGVEKPADGLSGYETGCLFQNTAGGDGTALYVNEGTVDSCNFNAVTVGA